MDVTLRQQILRASVRDRMFLKAVCRDLAPDDFPTQEEQIVARIALEFWDTHGEPVGGLLRSDADDAARQARMPADKRKKLMELVDLIQSSKMDLVPVRALEDRVLAIKRSTFFEKALEEIVTAEEKKQFNVGILENIVERAQKELADRLYISTDYLNELEKRIQRREMAGENEKYPLLLIGPLDDKISIIGRGMFGILVGPYSSGKSMFLTHIALAYALQGLKVLYFTLEDPLDLVQSRMDSNLSGIPIAKLNRMPNRLRRRFHEMRQLIRGRVKIVDATEGGLTITKIHKVWEQERSDGFAADAIIVDYDEELECEVKFTGEGFRKQQFEEIYKRFRRMCKRLDVIGWTAAQTKAGRVKKRILTGDDIGEDYSKVKKAFIGIGIGQDPDHENVKHLYVMRHRSDKSKFGVDVVTDFECGIAYDAEETRKMERIAKK